MWRWLQPGLGIKRWITLITFSSVAFGLGVSQVLVGVFHFPYDMILLGYLPSVIGGLGLLGGISGLIQSITSRTHQRQEPLYRTLRRESRRKNGPHLVAFGGGTGLSTLLRGLREMTSNITAIVAVTDDGGSSGRIRRDFDLPAPGDLRDCLVALAPEEERLSEVVRYRFENGKALEGHSFGNLLLTALTDITGGFPEAIRECSRVLNIQGRVLPSMLGSPQLRAEMPDGSIAEGETSIAEGQSLPVDLNVQPDPVEPNPEAIGAVVNAEMIIVGPGSLYTSILSNFLEPELCNAVAESEATKVFICNLMTQAGETANYTVSDHVRTLKEIPPTPIEFDYLLVNTRQAPRSALEEYEKEGAEQVVFDYDNLKDFDCEVYTGDFLTTGNPLRHDVTEVRIALEDIFSQPRTSTS